ncbi:MAG: FAD-dependent oxidoreductase [Verrucomicrobiales bacterium]|nr:FAD-dependent oxidoreductase [Verrucomicrobiales bacterium]
MVKVHRQVVIIGAGIAGLWTLRRLVAAGYDAILLEQEAIGSGQTLGAQGILHGGVKYGLDGSNRDIAARLRSLPPIWLECLAGTREPSLSAARTLSPCQHLWAADSWLAKVGATVGARAMQGEVRKLDKTEWPEALTKGGHKGSVYELAETVIDVKSVLAALAAPVKDRIFLGKITGFQASSLQPGTADGLASIECGDVQFTSDVFLFMAATGNEEAAQSAGFGPAATQRRPLKQVMVRGKLPPLYGHCVTATPKPVVTITAHPMDDETVWYLGGGVAEDAVNLSDEDAILNAMNKLRAIFPEIPWKQFAWACWKVDRSEPNAASRLPDGPALLEAGNTALAWPTKLVYAPALADLALEFTARHVPTPTSPAQTSPAPASPAETIPLPGAPMGKFPWETAIWQTLK